MNYYILKTDELYHHGILGQKWGVRRYQNKDGSLTNAGKRRYGNMSDKKLYKTLKREIQSKRGEVHGGSNRWMRNLSVGKESEKLLSDYRKSVKNYEKTKEYKDWAKKVKELEDAWESQDYYDDESTTKYADAYEKLMSQKPKMNTDNFSFSITYTSEGRKYSNDYLTNAGKKLSMAYLQDIGYNKEVSEQFVDRLIKANYSLGAV